MRQSRLQHRYRYLWLAIAALIFATTVFSAFALSVYAVESTVNLIEDKSGGVPMLTAGTKALVRLPFIPFSNYPGMMLNVTTTMTGTADDPLQFTPTSLYQTQSYIGLNTLAYLDYEIEVPITAKPGIHSLTLTVSYDAVSIVDNQMLTGQTAQLTYFYTIINDSYDEIVAGNPLRVTGSILPDSVKAGDVFEVGITLQNDVPAEITGVSVTVNLPGTDFLLLNDANTKTVTVPANGTSVVTFRVAASSEIQGGPRQFTLDLAYANPGGKEFKLQYYMIVSATGSDADEADRNPATVEITGIKLPESASAGDEFVAVVTLTNTSDKNAVIDELKVANSLGLLNRTNALLTGMNLSAGETRSYEIKYYVPEDTQTAYANFTVSLKYKTEGGTLQRTAEITSGMNINALAAPSLSIALDADKSVKAGGTFTVTAVIKNHGGDASNISVTVNPSPGIVPKSQNKIIIDKLPTGGEYKCTFQLLASSSASDGYSLVGIDVVCGDFMVTQYTGTNVINPQQTGEEPKADMPVIIIDSYDYGGESVYAGKPFMLTLTIKNTSRTTPIKDMKMVIQSKDGVFTPTSSSNTFFVESLGPGGTVTKQIELVAKSDSKPLSYPIEIAITYKNNVGDDDKESTEEISIPVQQEMRFNKGSLSEIGTITMPDSAYLLVSASNLGMSTIRNVRFTVSGEGFTPTEPEYFAGTIEPGQQVSYEFELIPYQGGFMTGTVTYTYEDTQGEVYTETQEFSFDVIDTSSVMNPEDPGGGVFFPEDPGMYDPGMEEEQGFFAKYKWAVIGGGVAVVVVVAVIVVTVVVRRRKKMDEDEDYY